jgi:hypothetical protein
MTPRDAVARFRANALSEDALLRSLLTWPTWHVRVDSTPSDSGRPRVAVLRTPTGGSLLELFSDPDAIAAFEAVEGEPDGAAWHASPGWDLLTLLDLVPLDRINFDLHSPHRVYYDREGLPQVRAWARVVRTETMLAEPERFPDGIAVLAAHPTWYMLLARSEAEGATEHAVLLAPDTADRSIAALYTAHDVAEDAIETYRAWMDGPIDVVPYDPAEVFPLLQRMRLDGVVINPFREGASRAFRAEILTPLLDRVRTLRAGRP